MADSTPEQTSGPAATSEPSYDLTSLTSDQRRQWKETGEWPGAASAASKEAKPAESEPATTDKTSEPAEGKTAPESEPGKDTGERKELTPEERSKKDREYQQRRQTRLNRELGETRAELRRLQQELQSLKKTPESAPGKDGPPKQDDFDTYEAFDKAREDWARADERRKFEADQRAKSQKEQQAKTAESWKKTVNGYLKAHPDRKEGFTEAFEVVDKALDSPKGEAIVSAILESEHGPALVDYLAEHEEEMDALLEKSPYAALRELAKIELRVGKPAPPPKKISDAPNPPREVGGRSVSTKDEADSALERGDYRKFKQIEDARDAERFAGKQRR